MQTVGVIFVAVFLAAVIGIRQLAQRKPETVDKKDDTAETICPYCKKPTQKGNYCQKCGEKLSP